jgi:GlcNAc-P-P-Und epimerase
MNILITGGSGFIGTRMASDLLEAGHHVAIYDLVPSAAHPGRCTQADVRDLKALKGAVAGQDVIVHLAAEHRDDVRPVSLYEDVNVGGAENVVAAARHSGCKRIIFTSSVAVYPLNVPAPTENDEPKPFNEYGKSKLKAEGVFRRWAQETPGATLMVARLCVVFGEGNRGNVYNLLAQIRGRCFLMVGRGSNRKSMAYVGNVSRFLTGCLAWPPGTQLLNYADKPDLSVADLVVTVRRALGRSGQTGGIRVPVSLGLAAGMVLDGVARVCGRRFPISAIRIRKFCAETTVATERLEQTGFVRPFSLQEALVRTIRHEFAPSAD